MNNEFDPSKAQIGARAFLMGREGLVDPRNLVKDGHRKEASSGMPMPQTIEGPQFPAGSGHDSPGPRFPDLEPDLEPHGVHQAPKPDVRSLVKSRLENMSLTFENEEEDIIQSEIEQREADHEAFKNTPTKTYVDRSGLTDERGHSFTNQPRFSKMANSVLSIVEEEDAHPIKIMLILDQQWGEEWHTWEIETINRMVQDEGLEINRVNQDKIMALKVLRNTTSFFEDPRVFEKVCLSFAGRQVDWGHVQEPKIYEIAACISLVERYVREEPFSETVATYVAASALRDGFILLPPVLSFAQFPFSKELAMNVGDEILDKQHNLMTALEEEDHSILQKDEAIQYMRLMKCQYHIQDKIDEARS